MKKFALVVVLLAASVAAQSETQKVDLKIPDDPKEEKIHEDRVRNETERRGSRISGGWTASSTQFPFVAEISISTTSGGGLLCTGSLISNRWIVGASHCVANVQVASLRAFMGSNDRQAIRYTAWSDSFVWLVMNGQPYPDIALFRLTQNVPFSSTIQPIRLPTYSQKNFKFEGFTGTAIGWGGNGLGGFPRYLQYTNFLILFQSNCNLDRDRGSFSMCSQSQISSSLVGGDSGGPLIIYQNGSPTLIGVNIWVVTSGTQRWQGSTRVSSFLDFIRDVTGVVST